MNIWMVVWVVLLLAFAKFSEVSATSGDTFATTTFSVHVLQVVDGCSEKKVSGIDAGRIVASMQDAKPIRDRSDEEFVGGAICQQHPSRSGAGIDYSVPVLVGAACPKDAAVRFFVTDVAKEAVDKWNDSGFLVANLRTELTIAWNLKLAAMSKKNNTADGAIDGRFSRLVPKHDALLIRDVVCRADWQVTTADPLV
jgi:hypothetical protein